MQLASENARLLDLAAFGLLDTPPEPQLDSVVQLAARLLDAPIALLSLVDRERQYFKSRIGIDVVETPRPGSFCSHAILGTDLFVVPDAAGDPRFARHPLVIEGPRLRFYAAMPLVTPRRSAIGTLCVMDRRPRALSAAQGQTLAALGRHLANLLEARRVERIRRRLVQALDTELRAPLDSIRSAAAESLAGEPLSRREANRLVGMLANVEDLDGLLDIASELSRLGVEAPPPLSPRAVDLGELCKQVLGEDAGPAFTVEGDCTGSWDRERLEQLVSLLVEEAYARSPRSREVQVAAKAAGESVLLEVRVPAVIPGQSLRLDLARELSLAHGGQFEIGPSPQGTVLRVCLPRVPPL